MDLIQIGKFIAELRKAEGLTQEQLGEKIGVTNKTVSRWETGMYLPPAEALMAMSELFDVSINEILSGKRLSEEAYKAAAEENLRKTIESSSFSLGERIDYYKKKWLKDHLAVMICLGACDIIMLLASAVLKQPLLISVTMLLLLLEHAWRNNTMMTYVERHAFDGSGRQ